MTNIPGRQYTACIAIMLMGMCAARARADQESDLLKKFQQQNHKAAAQAKALVEKNAARAFQISAQEPEQALELLRQAREVLSAADALPRSEKLLLSRTLDDGFRDVKARLESKAEAARKLAKAFPTETSDDGKQLKKFESPPGATAKVDQQPGVKPILFVPNIVPLTYSSATSVTPIVSPDRRWVRISFSGGFSIR